MSGQNTPPRQNADYGVVMETLHRLADALDVDNGCNIKSPEADAMRLAAKLIGDLLVEQAELVVYLHDGWEPVPADEACWTNAKFCCDRDGNLLYRRTSRGGVQ